LILWTRDSPSINVFSIRILFCLIELLNLLPAIIFLISFGLENSISPIILVLKHGKSFLSVLSTFNLQFFIRKPDFSIFSNLPAEHTPVFNRQEIIMSPEIPDEQLKYAIFINNFGDTSLNYFYKR